jgi:hypothetical protein
MNSRKYVKMNDDDSVWKKAVKKLFHNEGDTTSVSFGQYPQVRWTTSSRDPPLPFPQSPSPLVPPPHPEHDTTDDGSPSPHPEYRATDDAPLPPKIEDKLLYFFFIFFSFFPFIHFQSLFFISGANFQSNFLLHNKRYVSL